MSNPWTKKNPALSMLLSGANAWAGAARGMWAAAARRRQAAALKEGAKQAASLRAAALAPTSKGKKPGKRR